MISLILSFAVLIIGYLVYGRLVETVFGPDDRETAAYRRQDGVDFVPMPTWKAFLVQLLNIAGTGPIFGALMGACFGPVVFLWIIFGSVLAIVGVIACPITSGDTAFRSARLILAEITKLDQKQTRSRLVITIPLLAAGAVLTQLDFNVLWRYFSWSNQTLAMISLWVATVYLLKTRGNQRMSLLTALPATFMTAVSLTYITMAQEGFRLPAAVGYPVGIAAAAVLFFMFSSAEKWIRARRPFSERGEENRERQGASAPNYLPWRRGPWNSHYSEKKAWSVSPRRSSSATFCTSRPLPSGSCWRR